MIGKIIGPITELNKELLSQLSSVQELYLKKNYYNSVCKNPQDSLTPSLKFLNLLLTKGKNIFYSTTEDVNYRGFQNNFLEDLERDGAKLFFDFLSGLQGSTAIAGCLRSEIPILEQIMERYKVLEEDLEPKNLIKPEEVPSIFNGLKRLNRIYEKCEKIRENYEKEIKSGKRKSL